MIIREYRLKFGWTQSELSEISGLSLRTIQRIENGATPSLESLKALAAVFETDIETLRENEKIDEEILNGEEKEVLQHVRNIKQFIQEVFAYFIIIPLLALLNMFNSDISSLTVLTAFVWAVRLICIGRDLFEIEDFLGENWERQQFEKRLRRKVK